MRLVLDRRARLWLRRLPRVSLYSAGEIVLLALLALQVARLLYAIVTPPGPIGDWRAADAAGAGGSRGVLSSFDPFHRLAGGDGPVIVTALNLKLYGIRADQASGRGSAIIGLPDGSQTSYAVGEEISSGVSLKAIAFDHVTIARGGADEQLYLDESAPATVVSPGVPPTVLPAASPVLPGAPVDAPPASGGKALIGDTALSPRVQNGRVTGFILQPRAGGAAFAAAGFRPGDVLVAVNGVAVGQGADFSSMLTASGGSATALVERGGRQIPLSVKVAP